VSPLRPARAVSRVLRDTWCCGSSGPRPERIVRPRSYREDLGLIPIAVVVPMSAQPHDDDQLDEPFCSGGIQWRRTFREVEAECDRLDEKMAGVIPRDPSAMNELHQGILGMWAAAAWTTGALPQAPMTPGSTPLEMPALIQQSKLALAGSSDGDLPVWAYAEGVTSWLGWITGGVESLKYPGEI
jgi:hypothetical protein